MQGGVCRPPNLNSRIAFDLCRMFRVCDILRTTFPLILEFSDINKTFLLSFLCSLCICDNKIKVTIMVFEIFTCLSPRFTLLITPLNISNSNKVVKIGMDNRRHFFGNLFLSILRLAIHLEHIHGCWLHSNVRQQHLIIHCPVLSVLL